MDDELRYINAMKHLVFIAALAAATLPAPAMSQASDFTLINGTGKSLGNLSVRRSGSNQWKPLGSAPAPDGRASMAFSDPDCAFDIRADAAGGEMVWSGVNLCEVSAVTLRVAAGTPYAEYR